MKPDVGFESRFLPTLLAFDALVGGGGFPSEYCYDVWQGKTRMMWLPIVKKLNILVLTEFTNVTDVRQTHTDAHRMTA